MGILEFAKSTSGHFFRKGTILRNQSKSSVEVHDHTSYDSLINHHPDTIFAMDLHGNILSCNSNIEGILGFSSNEIHGPFHRLVKKENLKKVINHYEQAIAGFVQNYECICIHRDGHFVTFQVTNIPMYSNGEIVGVYGIAKDITEHRLTEIRLKENETQFQHIYDSLKLGVWSWDVRLRKTLYVSPTIETLSGIELASFKEGFINWKKIVHPEDTLVFVKNQKDLRNGIPCQYQYRIIDRTGKVKWVEAHTFPVLDSNGLLVRLDGLITDISNKKLEEEKVNYYAYHDYLTGLPNRRMVEGKIDQFITDKQGKSERFALLYLDLDRFKFVNDTLGHMIGDELLKQVSSRLANHLKDHDHLARLGGDEFAIIVNNLKDTNEAIKIASNIIKDIENPFTVGDYNLNITTSIGIGVYPEDGLTLKELFANTDVALYRAKGMGKNNLQLYSPSMNIESYKQFLLVNDLRDAIKDNQFVLHYQPKVNPKTREIVGAEALIRWNHPEWGTLSPNEFIPLAEETNLIIELGDWVITTVCKQIKKWKEDGKRVVPVSINLSAKRFLKDDLVSTLEKVLEETNIESKWLEFEITETSLIQNEERALSAIKLLKDIGITISLDDFGTGYSSISYLKKFKVDFLKIDRSFIKGIHSKTDDEAIIKSILFLAGELNIKVIAEGVETEEQLTFLLNHHCDLIQGFLFSKPLDVEVFTLLISKNRIPIQGQIEYKEVVPRREYFRIDLPAPILSKMTIAEMNGKSVLLGDTQVVIENIGMGGLRFSTAFLLPVSKKLKLRIQTELFQQPFSVEGSILWREEVEDNHYQYGFEFELTEQKREWLSSELNQLTVKT
jgi:diguanylate cyclase (GGDEF)-like protein/PAS domain S-box-containing protein